MFRPLLEILDIKSVDSELVAFILRYINELLNSALDSNVFKVIVQFKEFDGVRIIENYLEHQNETVKKCANGIYMHHFSKVDSSTSLIEVDTDDRIYF